MMINWGRIIDVPLIVLDGNYVAARVLDTLYLAEIQPIGPGNWCPEEQYRNAIPVLAVRFKDMGSVVAIRHWLDAIERSIAPRWRYKEGD